MGAEIPAFTLGLLTISVETRPTGEAGTLVPVKWRNHAINQHNLIGSARSIPVKRAFGLRFATTTRTRADIDSS